MLFVEDLLPVLVGNLHNEAISQQLCRGLPHSDWHTRFLINVNQHAARGRSLSIEQARILITLIHRVQDALISEHLIEREDLIRLLLQPSYRQPLYQSASIRKEVGYLGDGCLGFRFKFNDVIIEDLHKLGLDNQAVPYFERGSRIWVVPIGRKNIKRVRATIKHHRFTMTLLVSQFLQQCEVTVNQPARCEFDPESKFLLITVVANNILGCWLRYVLEAAVI